MAASRPESIADTPQTAVAATGIKRLLDKIGERAGSAIGELVTGIATEAARKIILPT
jgi:hypothetical protein